MKFNFDNKDYDSDKLSEQGKVFFAKLQNICNAAWTQEVKDAWIAFKQEQEAKLGVN